MEQKTENHQGNRFCKACGTPAEDGRLQYAATLKDAFSSKSRGDPGSK